VLGLGTRARSSTRAQVPTSSGQDQRPLLSPDGRRPDAETLAAELDEQQARSLTVLLLDERGTDGAQLDIHNSSSGDGADRVPALPPVRALRALGRKATLRVDVRSGQRAPWLRYVATQCAWRGPNGSKEPTLTRPAMGDGHDPAGRTLLSGISAPGRVGACEVPGRQAGPAAGRTVPIERTRGFPRESPL
jgi:hypothetical protein